MNHQYLEYVRQQLIVATADLSGATKGQLMAWLENAQFDTSRFRRKKVRVMDEVNGKSTAGHQRYLCSHCRKTWQLQFT
ncbi:bacteriophage antitermination protein Q, partial [Escherichia coli]